MCVSALLLASPPWRLSLSVVITLAIAVSAVAVAATILDQKNTTRRRLTPVFWARTILTIPNPPRPMTRTYLGKTWNHDISRPRRHKTVTIPLLCLDPAVTWPWPWLLSGSRSEKVKLVSCDGSFCKKVLIDVYFILAIIMIVRGTLPNIPL